MNYDNLNDRDLMLLVLNRLDSIEKQLNTILVQNALIESNLDPDNADDIIGQAVESYRARPD